MLTAVARQEFNLVLQVHLLHVTPAKALSQFAVQGANHAACGSALDSLALHLNDRGDLESERRAMKVEMGIFRCLRELMAFDSRVVLGETDDFSALASFAKPIPDDLKSSAKRLRTAARGP
jgi:hypothetical protein